MSGYRIGALIIVGVLVGLSFSSVGWGEDGIPFSNINCGGSCGDNLAGIQPNSFVPAIPLGTVVITVAHLAPSPEDAIVRKKPATCDPVRFRIDTLKVGRGFGPIEVEMGDEEILSPGEASRFTAHIPRGGSPEPGRFELDQWGFRFRSEPASAGCDIVASGLFYYPDPNTLPIPIGLIAAADESKGKPKDGKGR